MKSKFISMLMCIAISLPSFAQEFMGIKVDGPVSDCIAKFKEKGFIINGKTESDVTPMIGSLNGRPIELNIISTPTTKIVWKFSIYLPRQQSWSSIKNDYNDIKKALTDKYGKANQEYSFFSSPYYEGDGYEMTAVALEKCNYASFWDNFYLKITKFKQVRLSYENSINSALDDKERAEINKKTF